jgi:hypothetical protein
MAMRLRINLDTETSLALQRSAYEDLRTMPAQAVALLRKALGLSVPYPSVIDVQPSDVKKELVGAP